MYSQDLLSESISYEYGSTRYGCQSLSWVDELGREKVCVFFCRPRSRLRIFPTKRVRSSRPASARAYSPHSGCCGRLGMDRLIYQLPKDVIWAPNVASAGASLQHSNCRHMYSKVDFPARVYKGPDLVQENDTDLSIDKLSLYFIRVIRCTTGRAAH